MNKLILFAFLVLLVSNSYAQDNYVKLPLTKGNCPIIIVEKNIIASESLLITKKELITQTSILKDKPNRKEHKFFNLSENGIFFIKLKQKIAFRTQSELNKFFGLDRNNKVYINGYLIENRNYKIATESINEIELVKPDSTNNLDKGVINIWTLTKEKRIKGCAKHTLKKCLECD